MDTPRQTMDFFEHQDRAKSQSAKLVIMYLVAMVLICAAVAVVAVVALGLGTREGDAGVMLAAGGAAAVLTAVLIGGGTLYRVSSLRGGGGSGVARSLGGRQIDPSTLDPDERRVINVVEEMAIASGEPVPPVYIMPNEKGINAFAAGFKPGDAVIGVTKGCVQGLTRDELQGVIAHEFSHILNGDMRLNIRLIGLLFGIVLISLTGHLLIRGSWFSGRSKNGMPIMLLGLGMLAIGSIGAVAAKIMQAAVSRQREFLADASAVQFTRNPSGIGDALRRIGGTSLGAKVRHPRAQEAGHMFFGEALKGSLATHPPLKERIRRVDPSWDGTMLPQLQPGERIERAPETPRERMGRVMGQTAGGAGVAVPGQAAAMLLPMLALAGNMTDAHIDHARTLLRAIPAKLRDAAEDVSHGRAVVYALLLDRKEDSVRKAQLTRLDEFGDPGIARVVRSIADEAMNLRRDLRLPLLEVTLGSLAHLSENQHTTFRANMRALAEMDKAIDLFEWMTLGMIGRHLDERFGLHKPTPTQYYALGKLGEEISIMLSAIAHAGTGDPNEAQRAVELGTAALDGVHADLRPRQAAHLGKLDEALTKLSACSGKLKRSLLKAAALTAGADREITTTEAELLRAVSDALGVPTPPLLPGQKLV
ncbi:MAG: M48 family metallopeptidase [Phycisphaerales bacterium]